MKTLVFAVAVLLLVTGAVFANTVYISHITDRLIEYASEMPETIPNGGGTLEAEQSYANFLRTWQTHRFAICLTVSHNESDDITELLIETAAYYDKNDEAEYVRSKYLLKNTLERIRHAESVTLEGIL